MRRMLEVHLDVHKTALRDILSRQTPGIAPRLKSYLSTKMEINDGLFNSAKLKEFMGDTVHVSHQDEDSVKCEILSEGHEFGVNITYPGHTMPIIKVEHNCCSALRVVNSYKLPLVVVVTNIKTGKTVRFLATAGAEVVYTGEEWELDEYDFVK